MHHIEQLPWNFTKHPLLTTGKKTAPFGLLPARSADTVDIIGQVKPSLQSMQSAASRSGELRSETSMEPAWQPHPQGCPQVPPGSGRNPNPTTIQGRPPFCDLEVLAPMVDSCPCFGYVWLEILGYFGMCFWISDVPWVQTWQTWGPCSHNPKANNLGLIEMQNSDPMMSHHFRAWQVRLIWLDSSRKDSRTWACGRNFLEIAETLRKKQKRDDSLTGTWHDKTASTEIIAQTRPEIDFTPKIMVVVPGGHILHWRAPISSWYLPGRMKIPEKSWGILAWWVCDWYL